MALPIDNTTDYLCKILDIDSDNSLIEEFYVDKKHRHQITLMGEIIAIENSIYLLRRTGGICGSNIDNIATLRKKLIGEYEALYGTWLTDNQKVMW